MLACTIDRFSISLLAKMITISFDLLYFLFRKMFSVKIELHISAWLFDMI